MTSRAPVAVVVTLLIAVACRSGVSDGQLIGTWTNDADPTIVLTLVTNPGAPLTPPPAFVGAIVGALVSPSSPGRLLVDVRRDALGKPLFVIPVFSAEGVKDILCQGCDVSDGHMSCESAIATTTDPSGGTVTLGMSCQWTWTGSPARCASMTFVASCPVASCPSWTGPRCGGGLCQAGSVCTSASSCECDPGQELACCDGTPCPPSGCEECRGGSGNFGCAPSPPIACSDDVAGATGVCHCVAGADLPFPCGATGTCEQACSGGAPRSDGGPPLDAAFAFDATLPEGGFPFDARHEAGALDAVAPIDASPCSPEKCGGCCQGGFCYNGSAPSACGQGGQACQACDGMTSCVAGVCQ